MVAGTGTSTTVDARTGRVVNGGGNYVIEPSVNSSSVNVAFECHATAAEDPSQTRILPASQGGCVLYKGGTAVGWANGQSLPGGASATENSVSVSLETPGAFQLCWNVAATFILNGGDELFSSGCTAVNG